MGAEARIVNLYVYMLETRGFFDNPDMGYDRVLRRCASDAKFASGGLLVDALFRFGLHMCDPENVVRAEGRIPRGLGGRDHVREH